MSHSQAYYLFDYMDKVHRENKAVSLRVAQAIGSFCVFYLIELTFMLCIYDDIKKAAADFSRKHLEATQLNNFKVLKSKLDLTK